MGKLLAKSSNKVIKSIDVIFLPFIIRRLSDWLKPVVILVVLAVSIIFGLKASPTWALLSVLLVGGFIGFIILHHHPEVGIFLLPPISFFAPWLINTGTNVAFNLTFLISIAIIGVWIIRTITTRHQSTKQSNSIDILAVLFIISTCLSLVAGQVRWVIFAQNQASLPAQVGGWLLYVIPIGLMLYVQTHLQDLRWLKILTWLFIALGSIYIIEFYSPVDIISRFHFFTSGNTGSMYWIWLTALAFGQFLFNKELHPISKIALGLLTIGIIAAGLSDSQRYWISGWLPPLIAIGTIVWLKSWRVGLAGSILAIIILVIAQASIFTDVGLTNEYSLNSRAATYPIMFELIKANPIIGLGFANYSHYTSLYPIWGWYVSFNSHNNYMDIIAQTGFIGLLLFLLLMIAIGLRGWKLHKLELDGFSSGFINGCLGGLVGMLAAGILGDWFLPYLYNIGIPGFRSSVFAWIFIGGLLAIGKIIDQQLSEPNPAYKAIPK